MAKKITSRKKNYANWYVDIILQSQMADYSPVKGTMVIRPYGYALWEHIQHTLDTMFKASNHQNAYFPLLIPESFIKKEAKHVEGFAPELAVVTHGGGSKLEEPLVIRPTSETIIWSMYKKWIQSYRDLPLLINQWANVLRWEKRTRLFLRTTEFLWQEGHTAHETEKEARDEALHILELYKTFAEEYMALPVITGTKSEQEKFAGAVETLAVEALMQDKKSLQVGTSHFLGQNFAKAFNVQFQNRKGILEHVWATSWGVSTRLIGAIIMCHSDDNGLVLPPKLAPTEIVIIPIFKDSNKTTILQAANNMFQQLKKDFRVKIDNDENNSPGWKFAEWELRGIPLRIEIGARDLENGQVTIARRDTREKKEVKLAYVQEECSNLLGEIQKNLYNTAKNFRDEHSHTVLSYNEMKEFFTSHNNGFIHMPWDGTQETETKIKQETMATIRVLPFNGHEHVKGKHDPVSGKPAKQLAIFAKAY